MVPGLKYEVIERSGPDHVPNFKIALELDGVRHVGIGSSKSAAKYKAAKVALEYVQELRNYTKRPITNTTRSNFKSYKPDDLETSDVKLNGFNNSWFDDTGKNLEI